MMANDAIIPVPGRSTRRGDHYWPAALMTESSLAPLAQPCPINAPLVPSPSRRNPAGAALIPLGEFPTWRRRRQHHHRPRANPITRHGAGKCDPRSPIKPQCRAAGRTGCRSFHRAFAALTLYCAPSAKTAPSHSSERNGQIGSVGRPPSLRRRPRRVDGRSNVRNEQRWLITLPVPLSPPILSPLCPYTLPRPTQGLTCRCVCR